MAEHRIIERMLALKEKELEKMKKFNKQHMKGNSKKKNLSIYGNLRRCR